MRPDPRFAGVKVAAERFGADYLREVADTYGPEFAKTALLYDASLRHLREPRWIVASLARILDRAERFEPTSVPAAETA